MRKNVRATVFLALFAAVAAAISMTAFEVARRTDSTVHRYEAWAKPPNIYAVACPADYDFGPDQSPCETDEALAKVHQALTAQPDVSRVGGNGTFIAAIRWKESTSGWERYLVYANLSATEDPLYGRPLLEEGRSPRPDAPTEVVVNRWLADHRGATVGSKIIVAAYLDTPQQQLDSQGGGTLPPKGTPYETTVVGIVPDAVTDNPLIGQQPKDAPNALFSRPGYLFVGPGWWTANGRNVSHYGAGASAVLRAGVDPAELAQRMTAAGGGWQFGAFINDALQTGAKQSRAHLEAQAARIVGLVALLAGLVFVVQALARQARRELHDHRTLAALGLPRGSAVFAALLRSLPIAVPAAGLAPLLGYLASGIGPLGRVRQLEVEPGLRADPLLLLLIPVVVAVTVVGVFAAVAAVNDRTRRRQVARVRRVKVTTLPASGQAGLQLGRTPGAVGVLRTALIGTAVGVAAIVAASTMLRSLAVVETRPADAGVYFDWRVGNINGPEQAAAARQATLDEPMVTGAVGISTLGAFDVNHALTTAPVEFEIIESWKGDLGPIVIDGQPMSHPNDILLAPRTAAKLHLRVGDTATATGDNGTSVEVTIAGIARFNGLNVQQAPGDGGYLNADLATRLSQFGGVSAQEVMVTTDPSVAQDEVIRRLDANPQFHDTVGVAQPGQPAIDLRTIAGTPKLIAALVAILALAAVAHALVTSVRVERRQFGVLRALGFTRGQVSAAIGWHASALALASIVCGVPIGIVAGRWAWKLIAEPIGLPVQAHLAPGLIVGAVIATLALANLVAFLPGRRAARLSVVEALRSE